MLAKFSIRAKIISVVGFLLVAMMAMGLLAVQSMRAINANTVDITTRAPDAIFPIEYPPPA